MSLNPTPYLMNESPLPYPCLSMSSFNAFRDENVLLHKAVCFFFPGIYSYILAAADSFFLNLSDKSLCWNHVWFLPCLSFLSSSPVFHRWVTVWVTKVFPVTLFFGQSLQLILTFFFLKLCISFFSCSN